MVSLPQPKRNVDSAEAKLRTPDVVDLNPFGTRPDPFLSSLSLKPQIDNPKLDSNTDTGFYLRASDCRIAKARLLDICIKNGRFPEDVKNTLTAREKERLSSFRESFARNYEKALVETDYSLLNVATFFVGGGMLISVGMLLGTGCITSVNSMSAADLSSPKEIIGIGIFSSMVIGFIGTGASVIKMGITSIINSPITKKLKSAVDKAFNDPMTPEALELAKIEASKRPEWETTDPI